MKLFCKIFGHKYHYYKTLDSSPSKLFRVCKRCMNLEDYRKNVPALGDGWFRLVQYNRKNKELIKRIETGHTV